MPVSRAACLAKSKASSSSSGSDFITEYTPHDNVSRFTTFGDGVTAITGCIGLYFDTLKAVVPPEVKVTIAFASIWCCIENILIAAASEGIFGVTRIPSETERETIKRFLNVPEDCEIPCWLALGYPKGTAMRTGQIRVVVDE